MEDEKYVQQLTTVVGKLQSQVMQHLAYPMVLLVLQRIRKA